MGIIAKWGKCDFDGIKKLQKNMHKFAKQDYDTFCRDMAKELARRLLASTIKKTPVGNKPTLEMLGGKDAKKTFKVKGESGKSRSFLTREGAILEQHWSGYVGGTLRRGWTAKTQAEAESGGKKSVNDYVKSIPITKNGDTYQIEIVNPVEYASWVEYGHRQKPGRFVPQIGMRLKKGWVKGRFMLSLSVKEVEATAPALLEKKLEKFLRDCFDSGE